MVFYAVVSDQINRVIEFFRSQHEAELMLALVLSDEPDLRDILRVEPIELRTGTTN